MASSVPTVVEVKTPLIIKSDKKTPNGEEYGLVKFEVIAPMTPCELNASLVLFNT